MTDIWNNYMISCSRPATIHLDQAESTMVNAFNVHALTREVEEFRPDVAYVWNIVGVGGIAVMATLQHLGVPWLWHLMDEVPITICRIMGRIHGPLCAEFDRQLDGAFLSCSRLLVDEIEAGGVRLRDRVEVLANWVVGDAPEPRPAPTAPGRRSASPPPGRSPRPRGSTS